MSNDELTIDVRMEPAEESDDVQRGLVSVRVSDHEGNPLSSATITVSADNRNYNRSKTAKSMGMSQTFENVPKDALTILIEATGFKDIVIKANETDFGTEITRGYGA